MTKVLCRLAPVRSIIDCVVIVAGVVQHGRGEKLTTYLAVCGLKTMGGCVEPPFFIFTS